MGAGAPRPRVTTRIGIGLAALLALFFPYWQLELQDGVKLFSGVGTAFPAALQEIAGSTLAGAVVTLVLVGLLLATVFRRPGVAPKVVYGALVGIFLVNAVLVWGRAFNPPEKAVFADPGLEQRWVDERVPEGASVTVLESFCEDAITERDSYFLTEFFNDSIDDVVRLAENPTGRIGADGSVVLLELGTGPSRPVTSSHSPECASPAPSWAPERRRSSCSGRSRGRSSSRASPTRRGPTWLLPGAACLMDEGGGAAGPSTAADYEDATNAYGSGSVPAGELPRARVLRAGSEAPQLVSAVEEAVRGVERLPRASRAV